MIRLILYLSILLIGCNKLFRDEKLTLQRTDYNGTEVRTDGYYYSYYVDNVTPPNESIVVFFLFRNGVILSAGAYERTNFDILEKSMLKRYESLINKKMGWGVFNVSGNKLEYEQWSTSVGGGLPVFRNSYYILNDTTLRNYADMIYHFKHFSPKPDSTAANKWIN